MARILHRRMVMPRAQPRPRTSRFLMMASVCVVIAALYLARDVLIPIALSVMLTFLLAPVVTWLERRRFKRAIAALMVILVVVALIAGLGYVVTLQVVDVAQRLPHY